MKKKTIYTEDVSLGFGGTCRPGNVVLSKQGVVNGPGMFEGLSCEQICFCDGPCHKIGFG